MARFRLLVIIAAVWITFIFNVERPNFGDINLDLDSVTYMVAAAAALTTLWLPDVSQRTGAIFLPMMLVYVFLKQFIGRSIGDTSPVILGIEIAVIYVTISLFRRVSLALLTFEQTVDSVLLRPDTLRVLSMEDGMERVQQEISRARRFERKVGLILLSTRLAEEAEADYSTFRFDLEEELQRHYIQLRLAQVAELVLYKVDLVMLHKDDVLICMPETSGEMVQQRAEELVEEVSWRLGRYVLYGVAMFPDDGFIVRDLVDKATVRLYDAHDKYLLEHEQSDDSDDDDTPPAIERAGDVKRTDDDLTQPTSSIVLAVKEILEPWPDVILQLQRKENFGFASRDEGDQRSALFDPNSWIGSLPYQSVASRQLYTLLKQVIDIVLVLLALPFILPIMGVVAALVWLEDRGPILFVQQRTGLGGKRFNMYKFRTMVPNAEEKLRDLQIKGLVKLDDKGKLVEPLKLAVDPRVTRIGGFLRRTSLDELPQLFNVLKGEMSIVGPRPTSWGTDSYQLYHTERLQVKPGITGLWQVAARGNTNFNEWVDWDRTYVDKMCMSLDIQILIRTFSVLIQQRGAR